MHLRYLSFPYRGFREVPGDIEENQNSEYLKAATCLLTFEDKASASKVFACLMC